MIKTNDSQILSVVHPICCGLDVHKDQVSACLLFTDETGQPASEIKEFKTFTDDLFSLRDWLIAHECPILAMESTGVYWRPIHNVLEHHLEVILVNARHVKNVPGRKTDISDCKWLAGLLRHGLLKGSFILPQYAREWRELWGVRQSYVRTTGDFGRRIHKILQCANIKIDSVVSDLFGATGRNLMKLLIRRQSDITLEEIEQCARGKLRQKTLELHRSIKGFFSNHHAHLLSTLLTTVEYLEAQIEAVTRRLRALMADHAPLIERLDEVPGINEIGAMGILSHIGIDLKAFPTEDAFCSWQGICPGNNESAGKRHHGKPTVRKHPLKTLLIELAWTSIKKKGSYYKEKFHRLKARIGAKCAITAIAHKLAKAIYHIVKEGASYRELGEEFLSRQKTAARLNRLRFQAKALGYLLTPILP
ncbi:MAG: IS110 family transposase [Smithella sp.]